MAQAGAAMAVSILTKNKKLKPVAFSSSVTAILGVTEPVLYGVTMPLKRPMLAACIAGAIGGGIVGTSHASAVSFAFPSMISLVVYFGKGFWTFFFALILGFVLGFLLTLLLRFKDPVEAVTETDKDPLL
jgi:PTS system beta-glucosides-specific IIC component